MSYQDRWIICTDEQIRIRGYYFSSGTEHIRYASIRAVRASGSARPWSPSPDDPDAFVNDPRAHANIGQILDDDQRGPLI